MRVTREKSAPALFTLFTQAGSSGSRGKITVDLTQVQAISSHNSQSALVGLLIGGVWVDTLLVEGAFMLPQGVNIDDVTKARMKAAWIKRVDAKYDELGEAWLMALSPLYKMEYVDGREYRGK
jgi:hypothetical protein